ncbi:hypothetical protein CSUI_009442, partial [Cystoisospora suis]
FLRSWIGRKHSNRLLQELVVPGSYNALAGVGFSPRGIGGRLSVRLFAVAFLTASFHGVCCCTSFPVTSFLLIKLVIFSPHEDPGFFVRLTPY